MLIVVEEEEGEEADVVRIREGEITAEFTANGSFEGLFRRISPSRKCGLSVYIDCTRVGLRSYPFFSNAFAR